MTSPLLIRASRCSTATEARPWHSVRGRSSRALERGTTTCSRWTPTSRTTRPICRACSRREASGVAVGSRWVGGGGTEKLVTPAHADQPWRPTTPRSSSVPVNDLPAGSSAPRRSVRASWTRTRWGSNERRLPGRGKRRRRRRRVPHRRGADPIVDRRVGEPKMSSGIGSRRWRRLETSPVGHGGRERARP